MLKMPGTVAAKTWSSNQSKSPKPNLQPHEQRATQPKWNTCSRSPRILSWQRPEDLIRSPTQLVLCILFRVLSWRLQRHYTVWRPKDPERIPRACRLAGSSPPHTTTLQATTVTIYYREKVRPHWRWYEWINESMVQLQLGGVNTAWTALDFNRSWIRLMATSVQERSCMDSTWIFPGLNGGSCSARFAMVGLRSAQLGPDLDLHLRCMGPSFGPTCSLGSNLGPT